MKRDRRSEYSKMVIRESIIQLLKEKPISKITVKEICEIADINRSTFYRYYQDPFDWIEQAEKECLEHINEIMKKFDEIELRAWLIEFYTYIKESYDIHYVIYQNNYNYHEKMVKLYCEFTEMKLKEEDVDISSSKKWVAYYFMYGAMGIAACWIKDGMKQSPEQVVSYILENLIKKHPW